MASDTQAPAGMTLDQFLAWDRIDERPYLEFIDGRIEVRMAAQPNHSTIEYKLTRALDDFAGPRGLGVVLLEIRCTFGGRSIVPDIAFFLDARIPCDDRGRVARPIRIPPDLFVEIRSPDQSTGPTLDKIDHALAHGTPLAWFIDPDAEVVEVHRPGRAVEVLGVGGVLDGGPVLPGFRLAIAEMFGWLTYRRPEAGPS